MSEQKKLLPGDAIVADTTWYDNKLDFALAKSNKINKGDVVLIVEVQYSDVYEGCYFITCLHQEEASLTKVVIHIDEEVEYKFKLMR